MDRSRESSPRQRTPEEAQEDAKEDTKEKERKVWREIETHGAFGRFGLRERAIGVHATSRVSAR
jgi:hypothetical protein